MSPQGYSDQNSLDSLHPAYPQILHNTARLEIQHEPIAAPTRPSLGLLTWHTSAFQYGSVEVRIVFEGSDLDCFTLIRSLLVG